MQAPHAGGEDETTTVLIKYVYLPLIRRYSFASTTTPSHPHLVLILQCTCSQCLYGELLTGLKQIDCQHSSQGPSIRLSLSAAHTPEATKHFALSLPHTFSPSLSIQRNIPFTFHSSVSFFLSLWLFPPLFFLFLRERCFRN